MRLALAFVGAALAWLWWEVRHAPDAKDVLPHSRKCAWCGLHMSATDRWLEDNGAVVTHTICRDCEDTLMGGTA